MKATKGQDIGVSGEGGLQAKERTSGLGVWLMHLRKTEARVAAESETMRVELVNKVRDIVSRS